MSDFSTPLCPFPFPGQTVMASAGFCSLDISTWTGTWLGYYLRRHIKEVPWRLLGRNRKHELLKMSYLFFFLFYSGVYRAGVWVPAVEWTCGTCSWQYLVFAPFLRFASFNCLSSPRSLKRQLYLPPFTLSVEWWSSWECITFTSGLPDEAHFGKSGKYLTEFGQLSPLGQC